MKTALSKTAERTLLRTLALGGAYLASSAVQAQISYTDIDPDLDFSPFTAPFVSFGVDMDNDGNDDFLVRRFLGTMSSSSMTVIGIGSNEILQDTLSYGAVVNPGKKISPGGNWYSSVLLGSINGSSSVGPWVNQSEGFLGVRFTITDTTHYGWIRLDFSTDFQTGKIRDLAYNGNPGKTIRAGQGLTCDPPANPTSLVTGTTVDLNWGITPLNRDFILEGRPAGASTFRELRLGTNSATIDNLNSGTTYEWQVSQRCLDGNQSDPTALQSFTIAAPRQSAELTSDRFEVTAHSGRLIYRNLSDSEQMVEIFDASGRVLLQQQIMPGSEEIQPPMLQILFVKVSQHGQSRTVPVSMAGQFEFR